MTNDETNPINIIEQANAKTLDYFNKAYVSNLELVQSLKTELFELNIQIETLEKTKDLYTYHIDSRRNVFSPISGESVSTMTKGKQITLQIQSLEEAREDLQERIYELEEDILFYKEQVEMLSKAGKCIHTLSSENKQHEYENTSDDNEDLIEFIETDDTQVHTTHNYNLLMLEDYEHRQYGTKLDENIKQELLSNLNKLDSLKWLLHSDIGRSKITLNEIYTAEKSILSSLDEILDHLDYNTDFKQPIKDQINTLIKGYRDKHPKCIIDFSCDCPEPELVLPSVITIRLIQMLKELFDNIFKHSNANKVTAKIFISDRLIDVHMNDNGVGIPEDYLERSHWASGLHRIHEIIYQLDGDLQIAGDLISGTNVRFSFPVKK